MQTIRNAAVAAIDLIIDADTEAEANGDIGPDNPAGSEADDVSKVIGTIREAYHRDWEREKLAFARQFLSRTWAGIPLPVLSVCGYGTQEIRYTNYLAYFLDGSKPHGIGSSYLDALLDATGNSEVDTYDATVETDRWLGQAPGKNRPINCYCDIVVSGREFVLFMENKIRSGESVNPNSETSQLQRYDAAIDNNPDFRDKKQIRMYLTPTGRVSRKSPNWIAVSYPDLIAAGLMVLRRGQVSGPARENLKRFLIDLSLGPFEAAETDIQELVELAEKATLGDDPRARLGFDQAVSRNRGLVELLMEG